uniref:Uncharacterized protein n=1 Tax=Anguilla anguilla TaxID=7936 RepID=A0A0E9QIB1_ANGAN
MLKDNQFSPWRLSVPKEETQ